MSARHTGGVRAYVNPCTYFHIKLRAVMPHAHDYVAIVISVYFSALSLFPHRCCYL